VTDPDDAQPPGTAPRAHVPGEVAPPVGAVVDDPELPVTDDDEADDVATGRSRAFLDWVVVIAIALVVAFLVRGFVLAHFVVDGSSMDSTLESGDRVFVNKMSYRLHDPNRGDVVVLHQISGASERDLIKRVIGLPGESVRGDESCTVFVDERPLVEPYLDPNVVVPGSCDAFGPERVGDEEVFVMGDNRNGSQDSRVLGPVSYDDLVGRAFVVFWPRQHWQWL
jgi:signal peptidase I